MSKHEQRCTCKPKPLTGQRSPNKGKIEMVHQRGCLREKFLREAFTQSDGHKRIVKLNITKDGDKTQ